MNWYKVFYWLTVSDGVKDALDTFSNIFTFFSVIFGLWYAICVVVILSSDLGAEEIQIESEKELKSWLNYRKWSGRTFWFTFTLTLGLWIGWAMTPTKKDCLMIIAGGSIGNFISNDSNATKIPGDVTKFLHMSLRNEIKDLELPTDVKQSLTKDLGIKTDKEEFADKLKSLSKEELIKFIQSDTTKTK
jgi:hypothetical protein